MLKEIAFSERDCGGVDFLKQELWGKIILLCQCCKNCYVVKYVTYKYARNCNFIKQNWRKIKFEIIFSFESYFGHIFIKIKAISQAF